MTQTRTPAELFDLLRPALDALVTAEGEFEDYDPGEDPWTRDDQIKFTDDDDPGYGEGMLEALEEAWREVWDIVQELEALGYPAQYEEGKAVVDEADAGSFVGNYACVLRFGDLEYDRWEETVRGTVTPGSAYLSLELPLEWERPSMYFQRMGFARNDGEFPRTVADARAWAGIG